MDSLHWVMQDVDKFHFHKPIPEQTKVGSYTTKRNAIYNYLSLMPFLQNIPKSTFEENGSEEAVYMCRWKLVSMYIAYVLGMWKETANKPFVWFEFFQKRFRVHVNGFSRKSLFTILPGADGTMMRSFGLQFRRGIPPSNCFKPTVCPVGQEARFDFLGNYHRWLCLQCPEGYYRNSNTNANVTCEKCQRFTVSSEDKTHCVNEYKLNYSSYQRWTNLLCLIIYISGAVLAIFTIAVFTYYRTTPLIRAIDFGITICHLVIFCLCFVCYPQLFIGRPTTVTCYLRPILVTLLNTLSACILIVKSNRVLQVFQSKRTMSEGQVKRNRLYQALLVLILVGVGEFIVYIAILMKTPLVITKRDISELKICLLYTSPSPRDS